MTQFKGIGEESPLGWVIEEFQVPMPGTLQDITDVVRDILKMGKIQSLTMELGKPVRYTRFVKQEEATGRRRQEEQGGMRVGEVARNVDMEEYCGAKLNEPPRIFFEMLLQLESRRLHLSHIGIGPNTRFFDWMGIDKVAYGGIENLVGVELVRDKEIPDEILIFFGSPYRGARADQVTYAIKNYMFLRGEDLLDEEEGG